MADKSIRNDFIEGIHEIFTTLFNDGSEEDGIYYYAPSEKTTTNIYGETKNRIFKEPILLTASARLNQTQGSQDVMGVADKPVFTTTYKSLNENGLGTSLEDLNTMQRGFIKFHDVFYQIDKVTTTAYVEDLFHIYKFECTELPNMKNIEVEKAEEEDV